jgi:hypothetical protein
LPLFCTCGLTNIQQGVDHLVISFFLEILFENLQSFFLDQAVRVHLQGFNQFESFGLEDQREFVFLSHAFVVGLASCKDVLDSFKCRCNYFGIFHLQRVAKGIYDTFIGQNLELHEGGPSSAVAYCPYCFFPDISIVI